jgi:predicted nucleic acid-binding protein
MRPLPDSNVLAWLEKHEEECFLSAITLGEIEKGIGLLPDGNKKIRLLEKYEDFLESAEARVLDYDKAVARRWAVLTSKWQAKGRRLAAMDSMIEASALHWNLSLVTRNTSDFAEVSTINPWI